MKTALISLLAATLLGFAYFASGRAVTAADFIALAFATGLVAWTVDQYAGEPRSLTLARPIRLPAISVVRHPGKQVGRLAA
ncbi:MAG: hypothetical protein ACHQ4G_09145 [Opitutales bacterium]